MSLQLLYNLQHRMSANQLLFFVAAFTVKEKNPLYRSRKYEFCEIKKPTTDRRKHDEKINEVYQHDQ